MTDEIERVREERRVYEAVQAADKAARRRGEHAYLPPAFVSALSEAIGERFTPKPTPAPKVWSVSAAVARRCTNVPWESLSPTERGIFIASLNAIVDDMIRDRPDAVAKEWERRYRKNRPSACDQFVADFRRALFPEVEG